MHYVYVLLDPFKPLEESDFLFEPFYVGMGVKNRMWNHSSNSRNPILARKISKIESLGGSPIRVKLKEGLSKDQAALLESKLISHWGKISNRSGCLTNIADGGIGGDVIHDHPLREDIYAKRTQKLKEELKGFFSPDHSSRVSQWKSGKPLSDTHREAIRKSHIDVSGSNNPMYGKKHSSITREKMKKSKQVFLSDSAKRQDFFRRVSESNALRNRTYEEVYGEERAQALRVSRSESMKAMRASMKEKGPRVFIYNETLKKSIRVYIDQVDSYLEQGWKKGRKIKFDNATP